MDLHFNRKNYMFRHLYDSYDKFLDEDVKNFMELGDHIFTESMTPKKYYKYRFTFENISVDEPTLSNGIEPMFPSDARHNNYTYSIKLIADVTQYQDEIDVVTDKKITKKIGETEKMRHVGTIPLMLRTKHCSLITNKGLDKNECDYDPGGYFIIKGNEKVVLPQDRMVFNKPLVFIKKESGSTSFVVQVNSRSYKPHGMTQVISIKIKKDDIMMVRIPILNEVNVCAVFRALGLESDRDIISYICYDEYDNEMIELIRKTLDVCKNDKEMKINTQTEAIDFLIPKNRVIKKYTETDVNIKLIQKQMHLMSLLKNNFLPHIEGSMMKKAYYLGYMINRLLRVQLGRIPVDDRDSYMNKRIDLPGDLMFDLFKQQYKKLLGECKKFFDNRNKSHENPINVISNIKPNIIEQGFKASLSTGHWIDKPGVAQMLQRLTYLQTISFLRRVDAPGGDVSSSKLTSPRYLHPSSVPFMCCSETPEHAKVGLTKHLSLISSITIMSRDEYALLKEYMITRIKDVSDISVAMLRNSNIYKVFLNGEWLGVTDKFIELEEYMMKLKLEGSFDQRNVSIVADHDENEIRVYCDGGRMYRPVIKINNNVAALTKEHIKSISLNKAEKLTKITDWDEFIIKNVGVVEYVDSEAQPYLLVCDKLAKLEKMRQQMINADSYVKNIKSRHVDNRYDEMFFLKYSHCEFHPSLLTGELISNSPFIDRNQGPRNMFMYNQGKQAMGIYATNYRDRLDISFILYYPQKPLVSTRAAKYTNSEILPPGENCTVAIACYTGYNQEDSLIFNKTSIERGKFCATFLKKYALSVQKNQSTSEDDIFMKPDPSKVMNIKFGSYDKLNDKGYVPEETPVVNGDVLFGKVTPVGDTNSVGKPYRDSSEIYKMHVPGVMDRVYIDTQNEEGYLTRKGLVRSERTPRIGDKYSSRHGQKGTIGILLDGIDMPFNKYGIRPDIILNPNAIPSRMTIGQIVECLVGKAASLEGMDADGTPFEDHDIESVKDKLEKLGYERNGKEYLYNGMTGEKMKVAIFFGPTYYQRLKHLVEDKIHSRARGPKTSLTRQAPEGRSRDGGLRMGEMERDALLAHGLAKFIKEKLIDNSDPFTTYVCDKCGLFAQRFDKKENKSYATEDDVYYCASCNNHNDISKIKIPYAFKLFLHELTAMCIAPRIRCEKSAYE
jgi:DNA-directed RNA polymerase II subunit RPB2